jgi:DNA polymerase III epsilon subunit-like protein
MSTIFVLIDLETTGVDTRFNRIVSIGAKILGSPPVVLPPGNQVFQTDDAFHAFVNPMQANQAVEINKITDEMLVDAPTFKEVVSPFWGWVRAAAARSGASGVVFVGHNIDGFDEPMLMAEHARARCFSAVCSTDVRLLKIDTMKLVKYIFPTTIRSVPYGLPLLMYAPKSYRQADIYEFLFHEEPAAQHSALGDVAALERILLCPVMLNVLHLAEPEGLKLCASKP